MLVSAHGADDAGVGPAFVEVAYEAASCHVAAGYVADGAFLFLAGGWVEDRDHAVDAALAEYFLDAVVVALWGEEGE